MSVYVSIEPSPRLRLMPNNNSFSVLLAAILLDAVVEVVRRGRISQSVHSPFVADRDAIAVGRSISARSRRAPDMQLWFNLIFASDTDQVLDGRRRRRRRRLGLTRKDATARLEPNQSWPSGSTEVRTALETI